MRMFVMTAKRCEGYKLAGEKFENGRVGGLVRRRGKIIASSAALQATGKENLVASAAKCYLLRIFLENTT